MKKIPQLKNPKEDIETIVISEENGFSKLETEGVSSSVFIKGDRIYKLSKRNSPERLKSDLEKYREELGEFSDRIIESDITLAEFEGETYTSVSQPFIKDSELKKLDEPELLEVFKENKEFLLRLLDFFFEAIEKEEKYPDIVGYQKDPKYRNIINLLLDKETGKILLCDIGFSPHEDTLEKYGTDFFTSDNVQTYVVKMKEFKELLLTL